MELGDSGAWPYAPKTYMACRLAELGAPAHLELSLACVQCRHLQRLCVYLVAAGGQRCMPGTSHSVTPVQWSPRC
jgi:hypothetical protein